MKNQDYRALFDAIDHGFCIVEVLFDEQNYAFRVGAPVERRVAILFNDITQRKRDEERLALLNREIDHRAKNMLAVIASIARLTDAETVSEYKESLLGRIDALAISQRLLSEASTEETEIARLLEEELAPFQVAGTTRVTLSGPAVPLDYAAAQALALAVHELATNAAKHGALSTSPKFPARR